MKIALTTVCNDNYLRLTKVMLYSFFQTNEWFDGDVIIIHDDGTECGLSEESKKQIVSICGNHNVKFHCVNYNEYTGAFKHFNYHLDKNLNSSFYKLDIFDFDEYDTIVQIDGDMLFLKSVKELFYLEGISMCIDTGLSEVYGNFINELPNSNIPRTTEYCNAGLIVLGKSILKRKLKNDLLSLAETIDFDIRETYSPLEKKWVEQDVINVFFYGEKSFYLLNSAYNMSKRNFFKDERTFLLNKVSIVHYLADKPYNDTPVNKYYNYINRFWLEYEKDMNENKTEINHCKIVGITLTYNEVDKIPYVMPYYERMKIDKLVVYDNGSTDGTIEELQKYPFVELRHFETEGEFSNRKHEEIKNTVWKEFKDYDWAMVTDFDEVIYCEKELKDILMNTDGTILQKTMLDVYSENFPSKDNGKLAHENCEGLSPWIYGIDFFIPHVMGNKNLLFKINEIENTNYGFGAHTANPSGNVKYFTDDSIFTFHLKYLDKENIIKKSEENYQRQIAKGGKSSSRPEFLRKRENMDYTYELMKKNSVKLSNYNKKLKNGLFFPIKLILLTRIDDANNIKQLAYSIREKLVKEKDIFLKWCIIKNNNDINNDDIFETAGELSYCTFVFPNISNEDALENLIEENSWLMEVSQNNIIHSNLRFLLRKAFQTAKDKNVICLNSENKDNVIIKKNLYKNDNLVINSKLFNNKNISFTTDDIIYEDEISGNNNKVSSFNNMARTQDDFNWDYGRLGNGEVTLKIESEWERIPLVYSVPNDVKEQIFKIIEESYKNNKLI